MRAAAQDGTVGHAVTDVTRDQLPSQCFNIAYSFETLLHINDPASAVANLCQSVMAGGVIYFNCLPEQATIIDSVLQGHSELEVDKRPAVPSDFDAKFSPDARRYNYRIAVSGA